LRLLQKIVIKFLQSVCNRQPLCLTSAAIAILDLLVIHPIAIGDRSTQAALPQIADGAYLYGEVTRPNVIGKEYIVIDKRGDRAVGAFYLPRSEFICFYGRFQGSRLNITLVDPFDRQKSSYTLAVTSNGLTASKQQKLGTPTYQSLAKVSKIDRQILTSCKSQFKNVKQ
jgi:hypothetical protein